MASGGRWLNGELGYLKHRKKKKKREGSFLDIEETTLTQGVGGAGGRWISVKIYANFMRSGSRIVPLVVSYVYNWSCCGGLVVSVLNECRQNGKLRAHFH